MTYTDDDQRIRKYWVGLSAVQSLLLLYLAYYAFFSGRPHSVAFILLAVGTVGGVIGVWAFTLWMRPERLQMLRRYARPLHGGVLSVFAVLSFTMGLGSRPEWFYAALMVWGGAVLALFYATLYPESTGVFPSRRWVAAGAAVIVGALALRVYMLERFPPAHVADDPWVFGMAISYARTGHLSDWMMIDRPITVLRFYGAMGAWLRLVGEGWWQARLFNFMLSLGVIFFSAKAARNLYNRQTAYLTAIALLWSNFLAIFGVSVRADVGVMLMLSLALWLYSVAVKRHQNVWHGVAGAVMGLSYWAHYTGPFLGAALFVGLYVYRYIVRWRTEGRWLLRAALFYGFGWLLGNLVAFWLQPMSPEVAQAAQNVFPSFFRVKTWLRNFCFGGFPYFEVVLILMGLAAALWRRRLVDQMLLITVLMAYLSGDLVRYYYIRPWVPVYGIFVGSLLSEGWSRVPRPDPEHLDRIRVVGGALMLLPSLGLMLVGPLKAVWHGESPHLAPLPGGQWVLENVSPEQTVVADHMYFLALKDYRFISPLAPNLMPKAQRDAYPSLAAVWDDISPDVFIIDDNAPSRILLEPLLASDYFAQRGYEVVFQQGTVTVYARAP